MPTTFLPPALITLREAAQLLRRGGVIAHATEGVFGLAADPRQPRAIHRLLVLKRRSPRKGFILLAAHARQLAPYTTTLPKVALATWPGPQTWIVPASCHASPMLTGGRTTVAVRVTAHPQARMLARRLGGPLVSTSANLSGRPPARNWRDCFSRFGRLRVPVLRGHTQGLRQPTSIHESGSGRRLR